MAIKICLDAGHFGKRNRSPVVPEYYESDMSWKLHLKLKAELEKRGFEVIATREEQAKDLALYDRGRKAKGCDLFMSLHSNATATAKDDEELEKNEKVDRVDVYATMDGRAHGLAKMLADRIREVMGTDQGGNVKTRDNGRGGEYYGVLRGAASVGVPGMLVEHSFHTNRRSAKWLLDEANLDKLAEAEADVLAAYYEVSDELDRTMELSDEGDDVAALQEMLAALGYDLGKTGAKKDGIDGDFGTKTEAAVKDFQRAHGLEANGIVDQETLEALKEAMADDLEPMYYLVIVKSEDELRAIQAEHGGDLLTVV